MRRNKEKGQAILLALVAMGVFLIGAMGLAIDGANLYGHRGMAQVAADAAAQAAILSIFNGTNVGTNVFGDTTAYTHTCTAGTDVLTPCRHARTNGFGITSDDVVLVDVPTAAAVGLDPASLTSTTEPVKLIRVTITRHVSPAIIRMLGAASTVDVKAVAVAAIVGIEAAVPILITHPTLFSSLSTNSPGGVAAITICGGPNKSIQVNSKSATALAAGGQIDLSHAGTADTLGDCTLGTGADLGVLGGPTAKPGTLMLGTTGSYVSPSSRVLDPFANLAAPVAPGAAAAAPFVTHSSASPNYGCSIDAEPSGCTVLSPGLYVGGLNASGNKINGSNIGGGWIIFQPGLYYMRGGGFTLKNVNGGRGVAANWDAMCSGCAADTNTGTGIVVYDTGNCGGTPCALNSDLTGGFQIDTGVQASLK